MKLWVIILIFVVVIILGMFVYLQNKRKREEEESKQLSMLLGQQNNLLNQSGQSGFLGGIFSGLSGLVSTGGTVASQNQGLISAIINPASAIVPKP